MYIWYADGKKVADMVNVLDVVSDETEVYAKTLYGDFHLCYGITKAVAKEIAYKIKKAYCRNARRVSIRVSECSGTHQIRILN